MATLSQKQKPRMCLSGTCLLRCSSSKNKKHTPSTKRWVICCPLCTIVSCIQLCWFSEIPCLEHNGNDWRMFWRGWAGRFASIAFTASAYEQRNSSVVSQVHSTLQVCLFQAVRAQVSVSAFCFLVAFC